jgi:serine protease Do
MKAIHKRPTTYLIASLFLMLGQVQGALAGALPDFTTLVKQASPAVVNVTTKQEKTAGPAVITPELFPDLPEDSPFNEFFKRFFEQQRPEAAPRHQVRGLGSGFFVSQDGYILTNAHVVKDAQEITVRLSDNRDLPAQLIGVDERTDVALIKVDAEGLPTVRIGDSNKLEVGEWVLAIGSPFGFEHTATQGIVSALGRNLPSETYVPFIQTDVAVNPGNSGGPLFNSRGEVVGINSQIFSKSGGYMGLSFAIPINVAMKIADQIRSQGYVSRGWLGIVIQPVTQGLASSFGLDRSAGALIAQVTPDSPADQAGLKVGDIILKYDARKVTDSGALPPMVGATPIGEVVPVEILREGKTRTVKVKIGVLKERHARAPGGGAATPKALNMTVVDLSQQQREELGLGERGVLVKEVNAGPAAKAGIRPGDIILSIGNEPIKNTAGLAKQLDALKPGKPVPALIQRDKSPLFLALVIPKT